MLIVAQKKSVQMLIHNNNLNDSEGNLSDADVDDMGHGNNSDDVRGPS